VLNPLITFIGKKSAGLEANKPEAEESTNDRQATNEIPQREARCAGYPFEGMFRATV